MTDTVTKERTGPGAGGGGLPWKGSEVCTQSLPVTSSMSSFFLLTCVSVFSFRKWHLLHKVVEKTKLNEYM